MLHISRVINYSSYGVVDTDDGVETIVNLQELEFIVRSGVHIAGVTEIPGERFTGFICIEPYQLPETVTPYQAKTFTLLGVDVRIWRDSIVWVSWDERIVGRDVEVRLSDFAPSCADYILGTVGRSMQAPVTLILDDKIEWSTGTFFNLCRSNVRFDLREVTSWDKVNCIYMEWMNENILSDMFDYIVDIPERAECYKALASSCRSVSEPVQITPETAEFVTNKLLPEFRRIADFEFTADTFAFSKLEDWYNRLRRFESFWRTDCQNYDKVKNYDRMRVFKFLGCVDGLSVTRFQLFMERFPVTAEVKRLYVKLCNRAYNWMYDLAEEKGW